MSRFSDHDRAVLGRMFDILIPEAEGMPSARGVGAERELLDSVVNFRPDLVPDLLRIVRLYGDAEPGDAVARLYTLDSEGFAALGLAAAGGYYMSGTVRQLLAYTGPERRSVEPDAEPDFLADNLLQPVLCRNPMWRAV